VRGILTTPLSPALAAAIQSKVHRATKTAQMPPAKASSRDSTNRGLNTWEREAPRAERTANSRARPVVRARRRFARLEQAMSSTRPERPINMAMML